MTPREKLPEVVAAPFEADQPMQADPDASQDTDSFAQDATTADAEQAASGSASHDEEAEAEELGFGVADEDDMLEYDD